MAGKKREKSDSSKVPETADHTVEQHVTEISIHAVNYYYYYYYYITWLCNKPVDYITKYKMNRHSYM